MISSFSAPPEPLTPPPGVALEAKPKDVGLIVPETFPLKRCPENALKMGAIVQPLKIARPTLLSFMLAKSVL